MRFLIPNVIQELNNQYSREAITKETIHGVRNSFLLEVLKEYDRTFIQKIMWKLLLHKMSFILFYLFFC